MSHVTRPAPQPISTMRRPPRNALAAGEQTQRRADTEQRRVAATRGRRDHGLADPAAHEERQQRHGGAERECHEREHRGAERRAEVVGVEPELLARERIERGHRVLDELATDVARLLEIACRARGRSARAPRPPRRGTRRAPSRSSPIWYSNISRCERIDTYSPAAIDSAPASRPATPRQRRSRPRSTPAPATPMIRLVFETSPSLTPNTAARRLPPP